MIQVASFGLRRLAVPAFAAALLSFTTIPSPAETSALAKLQPGKATEAIAAAATVVSSAYYRTTLVLTCITLYVARNPSSIPRPSEYSKIGRGWPSASKFSAAKWA